MQSSADKSGFSPALSRGDSSANGGSEEPGSDIVSRMERNRRLIQSAAADSDSDTDSAPKKPMATRHAKPATSPESACRPIPSSILGDNEKGNFDTYKQEKAPQSSGFAFLTVSSKGTNAAVDRSRAAPASTVPAAPLTKSLRTAAAPAIQAGMLDTAPEPLIESIALTSRPPIVQPKESAFSRDDLPKSVRYTRSVPRSKKSAEPTSTVPAVVSESVQEQIAINIEAPTVIASDAPLMKNETAQDEEIKDSSEDTPAIVEPQQEAESLLDSAATETDSANEDFVIETFSAAKVIEACDQRAAAIMASIRPPTSMRTTKEIECDALSAELEASRKREKIKSDLLAAAMDENKESVDKNSFLEKELTGTQDLIRTVAQFVKSICKPLTHQVSDSTWGLAEVKIALDGKKDQVLRSVDSSAVEAKEDASHLLKQIENLVYGLVSASETDEILRLQREAKIESDKSRSAVRRVNEMADEINELEDERDAHLETIRSLTQSVHRLQSVDATNAQLMLENKRMSEVISSFEALSFPNRLDTIQAINSIPADIDYSLAALKEVSESAALASDLIASGRLDCVDDESRSCVTVLIDSVPDHIANTVFFKRVLPDMTKTMGSTSEGYRDALQRLDTTSKRLASALDSVASLQSELSKYKLIVDPMYDQVRVTSQKLAVFSASLAKDKKDKVELKSINCSLEQELAETKAALAGLQSTHSLDLAELAKRRAACKALELENQNLLNRISFLQTELKVANERRDAASAKMIAIISERGSDKIQTGSLSSQIDLDESKATVRKLEAAARFSEDENVILRRQVDHHKEIEAGYLEEIKTLRSAMANLFNDMKIQQTSFASRASADSLLVQNAADLNLVDTSLLSLPEYIVLSAQLQAANKDYEAETQRLKEQIDQLSSEMRLLKSQSADVMHELEDKTLALDTFHKLKMESDARASHEVETNLLIEQVEATWKAKLEDAKQEFSKTEAVLKSQIENDAAEIDRLGAKLKRFATENMELTQKTQELTSKSVERENSRQKRSGHTELLSKLIAPIDTRPVAAVAAPLVPPTPAPGADASSSAPNPVLEAQIVALTNNMQLKAITIRDLTKSIEDLKSQADLERNEAAQTIEGLRSQVAELEAAVAQKRIELEQLESSSASAVTDCAELRQRVSSLSADLEYSRGEHDSLKVRYDTLRVESSRIQDNLEAEVSSLKKKFDEKVSELQSKLDVQASSFTASREREISDLQERHREHMSILQSRLDAEISIRSSAIAASMAPLKDQLSCAREDYSDLTNKYDVLNNAFKSLTSKLASVSAENTEADRRIADLTEKLSAVESERDELQSLTDNLSNTVVEELEQRDAELEKLKEQLKTEEGNSAYLTVALRETKRLLETTALENNRLQEELEMLKNTHKSVVVAFSSARDELSRYT